MHMEGKSGVDGQELPLLTAVTPDFWAFTIWAASPQNQQNDCPSSEDSD